MPESKVLSHIEEKKFRANLKAVLEQCNYEVTEESLEDLWAAVDFDQNGKLDDDELKMLIRVTFSGLKKTWATDSARLRLLQNIPVDDIATAISYSCETDKYGEISKGPFLRSFMRTWREMIEFYEQLCQGLSVVTEFTK